MSDQPKDGGPAFPVPGSPDSYHGTLGGACGMTLRDWFAGQTVAALAMDRGKDADRALSPEVFAHECYRFADAMLAERSKP